MESSNHRRRRTANQDEFDAHSHWRHLLVWRRGKLRAIKRATNQRERKEAKRELHRGEE